MKRCSANARSKHDSACRLATATVWLVVSLVGCGQPGRLETAELTAGHNRVSTEASSEVALIRLPASPQDLAGYQGQLVRLENEMVVVDTYNLAKSGQVTLAADERIYVPTNSIDPNDPEPSGTTTAGADNVDKVHAEQQRQLAVSITLDDGSQQNDPRPIPYLTAADGTALTLRTGSRIRGLTGRLSQSKGRFFVVPQGRLQIERSPRPQRPESGRANLVVASCNVLNFFDSIDDGQNSARGADSGAEFQRQRAKLVAALLALEADVIGLMELENCLQVEQNLVAGLNEQAGQASFAGVGLPPEFASAPGGDNAIRVGILYRRDRVQPVGPVEMVVDPAFANARTPLVQSFRRLDGEQQVTVVVNHFKSKGRQDAAGLDVDQGDGQGAYNDSRRGQAAAVLRYVESLKSGTNQPHVLVIGDLNAYAQEDPIDTLRAGGLIDLLGSKSETEQPYSYVYFGQAGLLDHAFCTPGLINHVTSAAVWHLNCDEPRCLDYNLEFNPPELFQKDAFRYSDHDPVLVGLRLE